MASPPISPTSPNCALDVESDRITRHEIVDRQYGIACRPGAFDWCCRGDADGHEHEGELGSAAIRRRTPESRTKVAVMQYAIAITRYA